MRPPKTTLLLALLLAAFGLFAAPLRAQSVSPGPFFDDETFLGYDANGYEVYFLEYFRDFTYYPADTIYVYKYGFGWLYYLGNSSPTSHDAYFYDSTSGDYFWTDSGNYPYFYSFNLGTFLYYYENSSPREFYDFGAGRIIAY